MKNRPPNVFVSSTMYDLSELRTQLGQFINALGWQAVMSEHDSFPIDPDQSTAENCRRNVRENADIFVMAVGVFGCVAYFYFSNLLLDRLPTYSPSIRSD